MAVVLCSGWSCSLESILKFILSAPNQANCFAESDTLGQAGYPKENLAPLYLWAKTEFKLFGSSVENPHSMRILACTNSANASANCTAKPWKYK